MQELEDELQKPTGIPTAKAPPLSVNGLLVSKECGILYEIVNTEGLRYVPSLVCTNFLISHFKGPELSFAKLQLV
jgi:hypothetical protein